MKKTHEPKSNRAGAKKIALAFCLSLGTIYCSQAAFAQLGSSDWQGGGGSSSSSGSNSGLQSRQAQMDTSDQSFYSTRQSGPDRASGSSMNALQAQMGGLGQSNWINGGGQSRNIQQQQQPAANEATWYQPAGTDMTNPDETELAGSVQQNQQFQQQPQQQYQQQQQFQPQPQPQQFQQQFAQNQYPQQQQFQQQPQQFQQQFAQNQYPQQQQFQQQQQQRQISSSDWQTGGGGAGMAFGEQGQSGDATPDGVDPKALAQMQKAAQAMGSGKQISGQAQQFLNSGAPQQQQQQARFRGGFAVPQRAMRPMQGGGGMANPMGGLGTTMNRALNRSVQSAIYKGVNQGLFRGLSKMRF